MKQRWARFLILAFIIACTSINAKAQAAFPSYWQPAFDAVNMRLQANLRKPKGSQPYWHVNPAPKYPGVYLWDSSFISLIWLHRNPAIAQDVIRSVLHNQEKSGRIPHVVSIMGASPWTQPPVIAWAAAHIIRQTHDLNFAREIYPKLKAFHAWLWKERRHSNGLFFWQHPYESGIDNSPRFGSRDESHFEDTTKMDSVDFTSYMIMDSKALAEIATAAGITADVASLQADAQVTTAALQTLWDETTGLFLDRDRTTGRFLPSMTIASLFPLTAGAATRAQYERLREHIVNPKEFNTLIPFPTVSKLDRDFEKDMWRGPVWINTSYLVLMGIKNYGDVATTKYFAYRIVDGVYKTWVNLGDFYEFYDPDRFDLVELTRKKGLGPWGLSASKNITEIMKHLFLKQLILGTKPVNHFAGWTGLVNTIAIEELGFKPKSATTR